MIGKHIPQPNMFRSWSEWASALVTSLKAADAREADRRVVPLAHKLPDDHLAATEDGILMYDPVAKAVVVSIDGQWKPIVTGV